MPHQRQLEEQADSGDDQALFTLQLLGLRQALPQRVRLALAAEQCNVTLVDGSQLSLLEAERILALKEERRAHRPLRASIDDALAPFRYFQHYKTESTTRSVLKTFLLDTMALAVVAAEALAVLGGEPIEDAASLARALDLPEPHGLYGEEQTHALLTAARDAARPPLPVARFRAPRAMAGLALGAPAGQALRFAWPSSLQRFDRHARTLEACCTALAWAHNSEGGRVAALTLAGSPCRRALGTQRGAAERAGRICVATAVLRVRAAAALACADSAEEARELLADAIGLDPGEALLFSLSTRPWLHGDGATDALAWLSAPAHILAMRDLYDDTWPLRTEAWHALASLEKEREQKPSEGFATAWLAWAGEWL